MSKTNINFDRERFAEVLRYYGPKGLKPQTAQLRLEAKLIKGNGVYSFEVNREGAKRITEQLLKRNDLFVVKSFFVGTMIETIAKPGHAPILTYPVLETALPAGYKGHANADGEAIYNGSMAITTGSAVNYQGLPLRRFRIVPETQPVVILDDSAALVSAGILPQFDMDSAALNLPERFAFAGTKDQKITITFPANANTDIKAVANTEEAYLVVIVDGWLVEGGTNPDFKEAANPFAALL